MKVLNEEMILGFLIGMMLGAILSGLAPAVVSLYIIFLVTLGYYIPVMLEFRDRWLPYTITVRGMCRQW